MIIADWSNPAAPVYLRTHGLPGGQPSGTGPVPPSLHGAISAKEHPNAAGLLARGAAPARRSATGSTSRGASGTTACCRCWTGRSCFRRPSGTFVGDPDNPTNAELEAPQTSILYMSPDQGGHTSMPVFGMKPKSYQNFTEFKTRDIVLLGFGVDRRPVPGSAALELRRRRHGRKFEDRVRRAAARRSKTRGRGRWSCRRCRSIRARAKNGRAATTARAVPATGCTRARRTSATRTTAS